MRIIVALFTSLLLSALVILSFSCSGHRESLSAKQVSEIQDSLRQMAKSIERDVSGEGPVAWLRYFENTPEFFMASGGQLVFPNNDSAKSFINNILVKSIRKIELRWSDLRIEPLSSEFANMAAAFHEDITDSAGGKIAYEGYFTSIARQTALGWKLHSMHWSITNQVK